MFIETSAPRVKGDKARLISKVYPTSGPKCFNFYFYMYGADIGSLNVYVLTNASSSAFSSEALKWTMSGKNPNNWEQGSFNLTSKYTSNPYEVFTFEMLIH
jgi:hypothetical protein